MYYKTNTKTIMPKIKSFGFRKFTTIKRFVSNKVMPNREKLTLQQSNAITKAEKLSDKLLFMTATLNLKLYLLFAVISKSVKYPSALPRLSDNTRTAPVSLVAAPPTIIWKRFPSHPSWNKYPFPIVSMSPGWYLTLHLYPITLSVLCK